MAFNPQKSLLVNLVIISLEAKAPLHPTEFVLIKFLFRCIWLCVWLVMFLKNAKFIINKDFTVQPGVLCFFLGRKERVKALSTASVWVLGHSLARKSGGRVL